MTYLALARKYRPHNFSEMVGQAHILKALTHALEHNRLHHAYLLTGTRGVGKTSLARILAKCFNCEVGVSASPCGECSNCQEIDQGRCVDVMEIDAASRTKVEDTRDLLENIQYAPQRTRFKIYIIDEVHMLSGHSFNALLKTLEEPPAHVKFILATTDPQKLPVTVLSRCLQFHLKNISIDTISKQLENILNQENIAETNYEKSALDIIARAALGSMRDALSILDQCLAHGEGRILENNVNAMLGGISEDKIIELLDNIQSCNTQGIINLMNTLEENGADFFILLDMILSYLQKLAVAQFTQSPSDPNIDADADHKKFSPEDIQLYYQIALLGKRDLPLAPDPKAGFMMIVIRMAVFNPATFIPSETSTAVIPREGAGFSITKEPSLEPANKSRDDNSGGNRVENTWSTIVDQLKLSGLAKLLAQNCSLLDTNLDITKDENNITLILDASHAALLTEAAKDRLTQALRDYLQKPCQISISVGKPLIETPHQQTTRVNTEKTKSQETTLLADKTVQSLMNTFSATLVTDSITDIIEE